MLSILKAVVTTIRIIFLNKITVFIYGRKNYRHSDQTLEHHPVNFQPM